MSKELFTASRGYSFEEPETRYLTQTHIIMDKNENMINWFEIPVTDFDRAKKFYEALIGSEMHEQQMGPYRMGFLPSVPGNGKVSGAIVHGEGYDPGMQGAVIYLNGNPDLTTMLGRAEKAGGKVIVPKTEITPEYGYFAYFIDTEGNKIGLHSIK